MCKWTNHFHEANLGYAEDQGLRQHPAFDLNVDASFYLSAPRHHLTSTVFERRSHQNLLCHAVSRPWSWLSQNSSRTLRGSSLRTGQYKRAWLCSEVAYEICLPPEFCVCGNMLYPLLSQQASQMLITIDVGRLVDPVLVGLDRSWSMAFLPLSAQVCTWDWLGESLLQSHTESVPLVNLMLYPHV